MDKVTQVRIEQALENLIVVSSSIDEAEDVLKDMLFDVYRLIQDFENDM